MCLYTIHEKFHCLGKPHTTILLMLQIPTPNLLTTKSSRWHPLPSPDLLCCDWNPSSCHHVQTSWGGCFEEDCSESKKEDESSPQSSSLPSWPGTVCMLSLNLYVIYLLFRADDDVDVEYITINCSSNFTISSSFLAQSEVNKKFSYLLLILISVYLIHIAVYLILRKNNSKISLMCVTFCRHSVHLLGNCRSSVHRPSVHCPSVHRPSVHCYG